MTPGGYAAGARVLAVLALGAGIVAVSDGLSARELRGPDVAVEATSSGITAEEILCPGAEFAGIAGVPDLSVTPRVVAAAAPAEARRGPTTELCEQTWQTWTQASTRKHEERGLTPWGVELHSRRLALARSRAARSRSGGQVPSPCLRLQAAAATKPKICVWLSMI